MSNKKTQNPICCVVQNQLQADVIVSASLTEYGHQMS